MVIISRNFFICSILNQSIIVCTSKGILIRNMSAHGNINWNSPNSEGFFKRVYFFDDIVVQAFRQMTMYQRITEVACLM
jgi:hypothetical protein